MPTFPPTKHVIWPVMGILLGASCAQCGTHDQIATVPNRQPFCLKCKAPYREPA